MGIVPVVRKCDGTDQTVTREEVSLAGSVCIRCWQPGPNLKLTAEVSLKL